MTQAYGSGWEAFFAEQQRQPYYQQLMAFLAGRKEAGALVYPPRHQWFHAFAKTPLERVKVVILGQDPYHGPGQAHGLSFSVPEGVPFPPSLRNIFQELQSDMGLPMPTSGDLTPWATQGVLLLNAVLTVEEKQAGSHAKQGWERFTDKAIAYLAQQREGLVFVLWGAYAQQKVKHIDLNRHCVLKAPHPSPLSAYRGFFGSRPFSQVNAYLQAQGQLPIDWRLP